MSETVIASACLMGIKCRYDGNDKRDTKLIEMLKDAVVVPVCPEQLGGLPTPRPPAEIKSGNGFDVLKNRANILDESGNDCTSNFLRGAKEGLLISRIVKAKRAYLKERSPSCGVETIKNNGKEIKGSGVFSALLSVEGIDTIGV